MIKETDLNRANVVSHRLREITDMMAALRDPKMAFATVYIGPTSGGVRVSSPLRHTVLKLTPELRRSMQEQMGLECLELVAEMTALGVDRQ